MPVTINASTSSGLISSADTSGTIELQSNGTTKLTVSSSGVNIGQMNGGAITSGTAVASTSGTSIDFTGVPSWVKRITLMFDGVSTNGSSNHRIQLGDAGGIETTGYASACSFAGATNTTNATSSVTGFVTTVDISNTSQVTGVVVFTLISANTWISLGGAIYNKSGISANTMTNSGVKTLSDTLTQLRITTVNGTDTFDAGSINILYEG